MTHAYKINLINILAREVQTSLRTGMCILVAKLLNLEIITTKDAHYLYDMLEDARELIPSKDRYKYGPYLFDIEDKDSRLELLKEVKRRLKND